MNGENKQQTTLFLAVAVIVLLAVVVALKLGFKEEISQEEKELRFRCAGELTSTIGLVFRAQYGDEVPVGAEIDLRNAIESGGLKALLSIDNLSEKNRSELIKIFGDCLNGNLESMKAQISTLEQRLTSLEKENLLQVVGNKVKDFSLRVNKNELNVFSSVENGVAIKADTVNEIKNLIDEQRAYLKSISGQSFSGHHGQRFWLLSSIGRSYSHLFYVTESQNAPSSADAQQAISFYEQALDYHARYENEYDPNNAKWIREEYMVDRSIMVKALLSHAIEPAVPVPFDAVTCAFHKDLQAELLSNPAYVREGGADYVQQNC